MTILKKLSSSTGDKTEAANHCVANDCLKNPKWLREIALGLKQKNSALVADCAEVFTLVAQNRPDLIQAFGKDLLPLLEDKKTKVRWEAAHTLSLIAESSPSLIAKNLAKIKSMAIADESTIVRDYCTWTIVHYAKTGKKAAQDACQALVSILEKWKEKQAAKVIQGFAYAIKQNPALKNKLLSLVAPYQDSAKGIIKKSIQQFYAILT